MLLFARIRGSDASLTRHALYRRAASGQENSWIVRSGWGARSEGVWVTDSWRRLEALAAEAEQAKQKWVVSKYVARPG